MFLQYAKTVALRLLPWLLLLLLLLLLLHIGAAFNAGLPCGFVQTIAVFVALVRVHAEQVVTRMHTHRGCASAVA